MTQNRMYKSIFDPVHKNLCMNISDNIFPGNIAWDD